MAIAATIALLFVPALIYRALQSAPPVRVQLHPCAVTDGPELDCRINAFGPVMKTPRNAASR